ncbi:hypothetical protein KCN56_08920 [Photobacterium galatheae]|uniref:hypothetical protein n=1 Tax=Photobacterium galatheae TaxID=1654360 RepID=UPI00202CFAC1|nr:hypothetical protein [Photobacterium galatheae]MCM0148679.1 hypothetical protein [Photobacterium galatheae]
MKKIIFIVMVLFSISCQSKDKDDSFTYYLLCNDLHQGKRIVGEFDSYLECEMDDGYSGEIKVLIQDKIITLYQDGMKMASKNLKSNDVTIDKSGDIQVNLSESHFYHLFLDRELALINVVNIENKGNEDAFFECENTEGRQKAVEVEDYIWTLKGGVK